MKTLLTLLGILLGTLLTHAAHGGGAVPQGMGLYQDGRSVDTVPAHDEVIRWYSYGSTQTEWAKDELAFAIASVDLETRAFRLLYGADAPTPASIIAFSFKPNPTDDECLDDVQGNCTVARTECVTSVKDGSFRFCSVYRVSVYPNNIKVKAAVLGIPWEARLYSILRHELGHVLGLTHDGQGPMTNGELPFTACQLAKWDAFFIDPSMPSWLFPAVAECNRQAQQVSGCPDVE